MADSTIEVDGIIKSIYDSQMLVDIIKKISTTGKVFIRINDSFSISSSVIGELLKLKNDGVSISMEVKDDILYKVMDDLNLISVLNIKKMLKDNCNV